MLDKVYSEKLLHFAGNISLTRRLDAPDVTVRKHAKMCGSTIEIDVNFTPDGRVAQFGQTAKACALGQAAASIVAQHIIGATASEIRTAQTSMRQMLKNGDMKPQGRFTDLHYLAPVKDFPARHQSSMLILDALVEAFDKKEKTV